MPGYLAVLSPNTLRKLTNEFCIGKEQFSLAANAPLTAKYATRWGGTEDRRGAKFSISNLGRDHYRENVTQARISQGELMNLSTGKDFSALS